MYNVKGPSKIVAKTTRRGLSQNIDTLRDHSRNKGSDGEDNETLNGPKPVFQTVSKKSNQQRNQEYITPQHEEIIKYINESWNSVYSEIKNNGNSPYNNRERQTILYYKDDPCPLLQSFRPFDLEAWWGKRLYMFITNSVNSKS